MNEGMNHMNEQGCSRKDIDLELELEEAAVSLGGCVTLGNSCNPFES